MTNLTRAEKLKRLKRWEDICQREGDAYAFFHRVTGCDPGCKLFAPTHDALQAYTELLSESIGDGETWLDWYRFDNRLGVRGMKAKAASWKRARKIKTLRQLLALIEGEKA